MVNAYAKECGISTLQLVIEYFLKILFQLYKIHEDWFDDGEKIIC